VVETNEDKHPEYKVVNKVLAQFAQKVLDIKSSNYVLIIDEINRANLPLGLGELIYELGYRKDPETPEETSVESMYSLIEEDES
jgi:5-methylcytosine-specific restriction protein B